jgi:putative oxidoreductase
MADIGKINRNRLLIPQLGALYDLGAEYAYAFIRFSAGAVLFPHGVNKVFNSSIAQSAHGIAAKGLPFPELLAFFTIATEFGAAAGLALGLFTRLCAGMIWIEMLVIMTTFIGANGYFWTNKGIEFALLWWLICTAVIFRGGGRYALDRFLPKEL